MGVDEVSPDLSRGQLPLLHFSPVRELLAYLLPIAGGVIRPFLQREVAVSRGESVSRRVDRAQGEQLARPR